MVFFFPSFSSQNPNRTPSAFMAWPGVTTWVCDQSPNVCATFMVVTWSCASQTHTIALFVLLKGSSQKPPVLRGSMHVFLFISLSVWAHVHTRVCALAKGLCTLKHHTTSIYLAAVWVFLHKCLLFFPRCRQPPPWCAIICVIFYIRHAEALPAEGFHSSPDYIKRNINM